jgi:hypothetical protein
MIVFLGILLLGYIYVWKRALSTGSDSVGLVAGKLLAKGCL